MQNKSVFPHHLCFCNNNRNTDIEGGDIKKKEKERLQILNHVGFFIVIFEVCLAQRQIVHLLRVTRT